MKHASRFHRRTISCYWLVLVAGMVPLVAGPGVGLDAALPVSDEKDPAQDNPRSQQRGQGSSALTESESEPSLDETSIQRLAGLCRLWGTVKYFHPYLAYRDIDWDKALVETIPKVEAARSPEEYRAAIDHLLSFLDDSLTHTVNPSPSSDEASLDEAEDNARADSSEPRQPYVKMLDEGTALVVANDYSQVARAGSGALRSVFEQCLEAKAIVFDLRRRPLVTQFTLSEDEDSFF